MREQLLPRHAFEGVDPARDASTAGGVTSGIDFGLTVVAELIGREEAETIQLSLEYAPSPPFGSGLPGSAAPAVLAAARERMAGSRRERERLLA